MPTTISPTSERPNLNANASSADSRLEIDATRPRQVVSARGLAQVSDETELTRVVEQVLVDNADVVAEWRAGDAAERKKKRGFLMGQAVAATGRQGNPKVLGELLDQRLGA